MRKTNVLAEEINYKKEDLHNWAVGIFNTMILLVRPYLDFMNVISILPPLENKDLYIQPDGPDSPPIFTKEGALHLLTTSLKGWEDELLIISFENNIFTTLFNGDLTNEEVETFNNADAVVKARPRMPYPGYKNLPRPVGATSSATRLSAKEKEQRNRDIKEFHEAGVPIPEIAELVGLSYNYTWQLAVK